MATNTRTHFTFSAKGHTNIQATHTSTFEVTTEPQLTLQGDCIIGVKASHTIRKINSVFGDLLRNPNSQLHTILSVGEISDQVQGWGSPNLLLSSPTSWVWRTSDHIDERTIAIRCDKAANDLNRVLIDSLKNPDSSLLITLIVNLKA